MNTIKERLSNCFALAMPELDQADISRASISSVAGWNSIATVNLVSLIEEEFDIQISDADMDNFVSFELILDYLRSKTHGT